MTTFVKCFDVDRANRPTAHDLLERLLDCSSYVYAGDWKYDRVPSDLVQDLLCYLASNMEKDGIK